MSTEPKTYSSVLSRTRQEFDGFSSNSIIIALILMVTHWIFADFNLSERALPGAQLYMSFIVASVFQFIVSLLLFIVIRLFAITRYLKS
jgi:hypothetical protein